MNESTRKRLERANAGVRKAAAEHGTPLGATGHHPQGKLKPDDEGEFRLSVNAVAGKVVVDFGKSLVWFGMNPREARQLAGMLSRQADAAEAALS